MVGKGNGSRNAGQKWETYKGQWHHLGPENRCCPRCWGSDRDQASVAPASVADGQTGRRVSKRVLLGLYPLSPRTWDHRWQYQLANAKRWTSCVLLTLINYKDQSPSSTYKISSQQWHGPTNSWCVCLLMVRVIFFYKRILETMVFYVA